MNVGPPVWHRLRARLRNTRNLFAREHPLFIFHALALHAARRAGEIPGGWLAYPLGEPTGFPIAWDRVYELAIVFPTAPPDRVVDFARGLAAHLADPTNNFALEDCAGPEVRTPAIVEREAMAALDLTVDEVCLDFLTPISFREPSTDAAREGEYSGSFSAATLGSYCRRRLAAILPQVPRFPENGWDEVRTLPWYWDSPRQFRHLPKERLAAADHEIEERDRPRHFRHRSKSQRGGKPRYQLLTGYTGRLFLRGNWRPLLPLLALASEFTIGERRHVGEGRFVLRTRVGWADERLLETGSYESAWRRLQERSDPERALTLALSDPGGVAAALVGDLRADHYAPAPAERFFVTKPHGGGERPLHHLAPRDWLLHRTLHDVLTPAVERMLSPAAIGYRPGLGPHRLPDLVAEATGTGCTHALEADIRSYFDEVDWAILDRAIDGRLPRADVLTRQVLRQAVGLPIQAGGRSLGRDRGLLQGSPLSPLLANLFLDPFDRAMKARGHRLIRFADDMLVLTPGVEAAHRAQADAEAILRDLGLTLRPDKTLVTPLDLGLHFVGRDIGADPTPERSAALRVVRPLWVRRTWAFVGVDGAAVSIRENDREIARAPLHRISELFLCGVAGVSHRLLARCAGMGKPVVFCEPGGALVGVFDLPGRTCLDTAGRHFLRHHNLAPAERLVAARQFAAAKIENYLAWFLRLATPEARRARKSLPNFIESIRHAPSLEAARRSEGAATGEAFEVVRGLVHLPGFASTLREPRLKPDRFNALLDFGYTQLFHRLHALARARGLNPHLGLLHDADASYPPLIRDLEEPFRARVDRWVVKVINRRVIQPDDFETADSPGEPVWQIRPQAWPRLLDSFASEEEQVAGDDPGSLASLLSVQVALVREWAVEGRELRVFRCPSGPAPEPLSAPHPPEDETFD